MRVARVNVRREERTLVSTVRLNLRLSNIAVAAVSILLLATLLGYVFLELHLPSVVSRALYSLAGPTYIRRGASG
jgi:hypothetical protein